MVRGIRNNNPGNIRHGSKWQGLSIKQNDSEFCQFDEMKYGCRALIRLLVTYVTQYNCNTIHKFITRYAPSIENNTDAYIKSVSQALGVDPKQEIDFSDKILYLKLAKAIAYHECGKDALSISKETWDDAFKLAF